MVRVKRVLSVGVLGMIGCGPQGVTAETTADDLADGSDSLGTESSETGEPSTTTTSPGIVPEKQDMGPVDCDPFAQDCPEGEKCVAYASTGETWDDSKCVPVMGDQHPGEACSYGGIVEATDDCDFTSACWDVVDVDGELIGTCVEFCLGSVDAPVCPPQTACLITGGFSPNLCLSICDPLLQDCKAGLACYWYNGDFKCILTSEDIPIGQPCGYINDCAAGLLCLAADTLPSCADAACCSAFCDLESGDAPCDAQLPGTACVPFFEQDQAPPGYEQVGICILPG